MVELLCGAGARRDKRLSSNGPYWHELVTLDIDDSHNPHYVWDLNSRPLPFDDNTFDELHFYDVLEHIGTQGDWRSFFAEFSEYWRILKPDGHLFGISPAYNSPWAWGDPGHTRIIGPELLVFLSQKQYTEQVGKTPMSDYRSVYQADFEPVLSKVNLGGYHYGLQAVKPSRIK